MHVLERFSQPILTKVCKKITHNHNQFYYIVYRALCMTHGHANDTKSMCIHNVHETHFRYIGSQNTRAECADKEPILLQTRVWIRGPTTNYITQCLLYRVCAYNISDICQYPILATFFSVLHKNYGCFFSSTRDCFIKCSNRDKPKKKLRLNSNDGFMLDYLNFEPNLGDGLICVLLTHWHFSATFWEDLT